MISPAAPQQNGTVAVHGDIPTLHTFLPQVPVLEAHPLYVICID